MNFRLAFWGVISCLLAVTLTEQQTKGQGYSASVLANNPVGYWRLDETAGPARNLGSAGSLLDGGYNNFPTGVRGVPGLIIGDSNAAANFNGVQGFLGSTVSNLTGLPTVAGGHPFSGDWTIEAWFVRDTNVFYSAIFSNNTGGDILGPAMTFIETTNRLGINGVGFTGNNVSVDLGNSNGKLVYAVITKTGGNFRGTANIKVYANVDGTWLPTASGTNVGYNLRANSGYHIGRHWDQGTLHNHDGIIDEVAIYNRALTPAEILQHFESAADSNSPPTVTCPEPVECQCNAPSTRSVTLTAGISDADGDALDVEWFVDGVSKRFASQSTAATDSFTHTFGLGASEVKVVVRDGTAEPVTCSTVVTVVDTEDPVAIVGPDVVVGTDPCKCDAVLVLEQPQVSDNCEIASVTNNAPEVFPLGTTTVTWTVTDVGGNAITAEQLVTVVDREAPSIVAPADVTVPHATGECYATVVLDEQPVTGDNCGVASVTNDAPDDGRFPVGETRVMWTVTDESGNTNMAFQAVTVTNQAPVAHIGVTGAGEVDNNNMIYIECSGSGGTSVTLDGSLSSDPDTGDILTYSWAAADGSGVTFSDNSNSIQTATFPMGATTVTLVVNDQCGAVSSTDVIIVIEDTTAPQIEIIYADKQMLWPPNHKMVPVFITMAVRDTCSHPEHLLVSCVARSNQPDDSTGDGSTTGDVDGSDGYNGNVEVVMSWNATTELWEGFVELRAERDGGNQDRKYSFHCIVMDASLNPTQASFCVVVPHDKRK